MNQTANGRHGEASKLGQFSWALFDWANQPFFTVITTFIFGQYFANVMIGDPVKGQAEWAFTQSTSGIIIAVLSPFLGAMADAGGRRKPYIHFFQCLVTTPGGGLHVYTRAPPFVVPNAVKINGTPVDLRGEGGFVVAEGSRIKGKVYKFIEGFEDRKSTRLNSSH